MKTILQLFARKIPGVAGKITGLLSMFAFLTTGAFADVIVIPGTSGTLITADKAANASSPAYTVLGDIVITESVETDFANTGGSSKTIILTAPAGWAFNPSAGSVSANSGGDISSVSLTVSATTVTITLEVTDTDEIDILTLSGIEIQSTDGASLPASAQIYYDAANTGTAFVNGFVSTANTDGSGGTNFASLSQTAGMATTLVFTTQPGLATVATVFGQQPVVVAHDQFGNNTTDGLGANKNVTISLSAGTGTLTGTLVLDIGTAAGNGSVSFTNLQIDAAGIKKLTATSAGLTFAVTNDFTVNQQPTSTVVVSDINPSCFSGNVTLTATVTPSVASGTVEFFDGATSLGTALISAGTASIVVSSLSVGSHPVTAVYLGDANYTTSTSPVISQGINPPAPATPGTIAGNASSCPGISGLVYSISPVTNATGYTWTVPTGWTITAGSGTTSITVTAGAAGDNGNITVTASNTCGTSAAQSKAVVVNPGVPSTPGTITGPSPVCPATTGIVYSITAVADVTTYTWTVPSGWTITSGAGTTSITVTSGAAGQNGNISVTAGNTCGTSTAQLKAVVVSPGTPATPGTITGPTPVCPGTTGLVYSITAVANATTYNWNLPAGWSITAGAGTNIITVTAGAVAGNITVSSGNSCGNSANQTKAIALNPAIPATPGTISGNATTCPGTTGLVYNIASVSGATGYTWTVPAGWTITAGAGTISITVTAGAAGQDGNITVTANNGCGSSVPQTKAVVVSPTTPATPGTITGPNPVCPNQGGQVYSVSAVANATSYSWTIPAGWSITAGASTNSITVTTGATGGNITVAAVNFCGSSDAAQTINITPVNSTNNTGWTTSTTKTSDAISTGLTSPERRGYVKFPLGALPAGVTINSAVLKLTNNNNTTSSSAVNNVNALDNNDPVSTAAAALYNAAGTGTTYNSSTWSNTGQISLALNAAGIAAVQGRITTPGWIGMGLERAGTAIFNFWGYSSAANAPVLTVNYNSTRSLAVTMNPAIPATPGTISGPAAVCANSTGNIFSITAVANATSYTWTVPAGWTITSGAGTTSITVTAGAFGTNGNITVTADNGCGSSAVRTKSETVDQNATVSNAGPNQVTCNSSPAVILAANTPAVGTGSWSVVSGPSTNISQFSNINNPAATFTKAGGAGTYILRWTITNGTCVSQSTVNITFTPIPAQPNLSFNETVDVNNETIITCGAIGGGGENDVDFYNYTTPVGATFDWQYSTNAGPWTSSGIPNTSLEYPIASFASIVGTHQFRVIMSVGGCVVASEVITLTVNSPASIGNTSGSGCSQTNFTVTPTGFPAGTTYSWTAPAVTGGMTGGVAGSGTGVTGNLNNATGAAQTATYTVTPVYAGTPSCAFTFTVTVTINPKPTVSALPLTQTVCSGSAIGQIDITNPNALPGTTFTWTRDNNVNLTGMAASGSGAIINGTLTNNTLVQQTTNFTITATTGSCSSTTTVNVKVNPLPTVNSVSNASVCNNANGSAIVFGSNVAGSTYNWTSTVNIGFGTSGSGNIPAYTAINGPVTTTVSVTATANGCTGPVRTFTITVNPLPTVTISADYCSIPGKVRLTANPLPAGTYTYLWSTGATTQVIDVDIAGSYTVTVTNTNGCKATNSISIATELAVNGDFEAGNVGFTSGYTYDPSANGLFSPEGKYAVNNNPNFNHNNFWGRDHTSSTGKMMIVNGIVGPTVWQQTVPVVPNTTYYFSAWALSMNNVAPFAQLQFSVNGSPIGISTALVAGVNNNAGNNNWQRFYGTWSSGPLTTATCSILDLQGALGGNDFALDDISISTLSPAPFLAVPSVAGGGTVVCEGNSLNLSSNLQGGSSPFTFTWSGPAGFTSNLQNPVIPNATAANTGTYSLSVTDFYGCTINSSRVITVTGPPAAPTPVTATPATICLGSTSNLNGTTTNGVQSDFTGIYTPANWSITNNPALTGGSVNVNGAPYSIIIKSGDNGTAGNTDFTITNGPIAGNFSFNWSYTTNDAASRDIPQYSINGGTAVNLPGFNTAGANTQSGTATIAVPANQTFALRMRTTNGTGGEGTTIISNFSAPAIGTISWFNVPTAGTSLGTSNNAANFPVTPASAGVISYYAQAVSFAGCISSIRTQVDITVNQPSVAPTSLVATPNTICNGQSVTLTQNGGSLGTGATWKWYSNNIYTTLVGTGTGANASLTVTPAVTTTYYLRIEGTASPCTGTLTGPAAGVTVTVRQPSVSPVSLNATVNPICRGNSTTLTQTGGSLGTGATWKWYTDAAYTVFAGNGTGATASLTVSPLVTTTYYLRAEGTTAPCSANANGPAVGITITVNQPSTAPTSLTATPNLVCNGNTATLTQNGGTLGTGASWQWYSNSTYTTLVGTGTGPSASLTVSPSVTTTYYLRIEGGSAPCTGTVNGPVTGVTVTVTQPSVAPVSLLASVNPVCSGGSTVLSQTGGSLGSGATWRWYSNNTYTTLVGTGTGPSASLTVSPAVTTTYYLRAEGAASPCASNVTGPAGGITVVVNQVSSNPVSAFASDNNTCSGTGVTLTLNGGGGGTGELIHWYTGTCGGTLVGTGNNLVVSPIVTTTYYGRYEDASPCNFNTSCVSVTVTVKPPGTWLGFTADWNDSGNWCGGLPTSATNVVVPAGTPNDPVITSAVAFANDLVILPGATVTIDGQTLKLAGTLTGNASLNAINGNLELIGSTNPQSIAGSMFAGKTIRNLKISNSLGVDFSGVNDTLKIAGYLEFGTSNATLNTNNNLTLLSTASGTASVADMTDGGNFSGNNITGNATVERYIPNHSKAWQFLATPTSGQSINDAWQEGNAPLSNSNPGYGTIITSNVQGAVAQGFDIFTPAGPTMKTYNPVTDAWDGVPSTSIPIANAKGYMFFVRGDRSVTVFNQPATATKLRTTGKLYTTGPDAPPSSTVLPGKFETIGNPYASTIDFTLVTKTGDIDEKYYVWDPLLTNNYFGLGGYQTLSAINGWKPIPGGTANYDENTAYHLIQSGQAFFVYSTGAGGTVSFTEAAKVKTQNMVYRNEAPANLGNRKYLRLALHVGEGVNAPLSDGNVVAFDSQFSNGRDAGDALKLLNTGENIGIERDGQHFAIETRKPVTTDDTVRYRITNMRKQPYQLRISPENMEVDNLQAWLTDKYLGTTTPVSLTGNTTVAFTVNTDPASSSPDRFSVVFKVLRLVPVTMTNLTATRNSEQGIDVKWVSESETNIERYEIERSENGRLFNAIKTASPKANNGGRAIYQVVDENPFSGSNFYRIRATSQNGQVQFSNIVKVNPVKAEATIEVYPNPVKDKMANIHFNNKSAGTYNIRVYNNPGQVIYQSNVSVVNAKEMKTLNLGGSVPSGTYQMSITAPDGTKTVLQILIQ